MYTTYITRDESPAPSRPSRTRTELQGKLTGGTTLIADYGDLTVAFHSDNGWVHIKLHDVAHALVLSYNLISLPYLALRGHTYAGDKIKYVFKTNSKLAAKTCALVGVEPTEQTRCGVCGCRNMVMVLKGAA